MGETVKITFEDTGKGCEFEPPVSAVSARHVAAKHYGRQGALYELCDEGCIIDDDSILLAGAYTLRPVGAG